MDSAVLRRSQLERQLWTEVRDTCREYSLLAPGDHVMVAMSGGKDSYTLLHVLQKLVRAQYPEVRLTAVHLDQQQPGYDGAPLRAYLEQSGVAFEILSEDTYSVVMERLGPDQTYCSLCSRLRRGILYSAAERLGCNKLALGHHRDDGLETFLMNLFYSGKLQAMPASYVTDDGKLSVIRPLIASAESTIRELSGLCDFPILPCNLCGSQSGLKRDRMAALLEQLEKESPHLRAVMAHALKNVRPTHLLDRDLQTAWAARPAELQPKPLTARMPSHHRALPIVSVAVEDELGLR
ncbi:MAG: tRNA(Cytosine32)-2-thiocytidine synthetase [Polyangiaceae bacterium]|jgi:tRNA 2-thiocytidine biosynthesis protein TtcA|nr:tRNA(Cytosine32)-2-thiocytidine synthetase [Polyangiaceae bacterium]